MNLYLLMVLLPIAMFGAGYVWGLFACYAYLKRKRLIRPEVSFPEWVWETAED